MQMNSSTYDVIIIGAGPGGIFCAYELKEKDPDRKILSDRKRTFH
jgi:cation diffusion facilitator CzcD-associated flavoprotein CzcO